MATSSEIMASSSIMATSSVMPASSASRDYAMHSIMNVSISFPFWHKFAVVNDGFFGMQKSSTQDQVRSASSAKTFRKALQRDEKSFTTANLCQNHQNRDTFSPRPRRDLRKTRSPPAPNARLERRREIGAIQAKMAHPQNNRKPRL